MSEKSLKPAIRFKGFTDDWEPRKLGELGTFNSNGVDKLSKPNELNVNLLNYMDVYNSRSISAKTCKELMQVTAKPIQLKNNNVLSGDVFFTPTSETAEDIGHVLVIEENLPNTVYSYHLMRFRTNPNIFYLTYPNYGFVTASLRKQMSVKAKGVQRFVISKPDFESLEVIFPSFEEQKQIAVLLENLDNLITLHQRKYEKLTAIKKALLEKMFPQWDEKTPRIRFKGFTDDWEQRKLLELGHIETGNTPSTQIEDYYTNDNNGLLWVTPSDIAEGTLTDTAKKLSSLGVKVGRVVPANSILCTCIASIGKNAFLPLKCAFNQQINALTPFFNKHEPYFLYTDSYHWSQSMKRAAGGLTFQIVNKTEFSNIKTVIPKTLSEEKEISKLFLLLDNLITLHQRKAEKLKNIKQSLLEKMFV